MMIVELTTNEKDRSYFMVMESDFV